MPRPKQTFLCGPTAPRAKLGFSELCCNIAGCISQRAHVFCCVRVGSPRLRSGLRPCYYNPKPAQRGIAPPSTTLFYRFLQILHGGLYSNSLRKRRSWLLPISRSSNHVIHPPPSGPGQGGAPRSGWRVLKGGVFQGDGHLRHFGEHRGALGNPTEYFGVFL